MPRAHVVKQGECLSKIAMQYGFSDYRHVYQHADNAELRKRRPNPNLLYPGDVINIPDVRPKTISVPTDKSHMLKVARPKRLLRLVLRAQDGKPLGNEPYALTFPDGRVIRGKSTDGNGQLEEPVNTGTSSAVLEVARRSFKLRFSHLNPVDATEDNGLSGIQARLNNLGFDAGAPNGELTPKTRTSLRIFQITCGLDATGEPDSATVSKLKEEYGS